MADVGETAESWDYFMKINKQKITVICVILTCIAVSGCGKKKEVDEASSKVIQISVAPEITPTTSPDQVNSDAVVTNGNLTMVNDYLAGENSTATVDTSATTDTSTVSDAGDNGGETDTDNSGDTDNSDTE